MKVWFSILFFIFFTCSIWAGDSSINNNSKTKNHRFSVSTAVRLYTNQFDGNGWNSWPMTYDFGGLYHGSNDGNWNIGINYYKDKKYFVGFYLNILRHQPASSIAAISPDLASTNFLKIIYSQSGNETPSFNSRRQDIVGLRLGKYIELYNRWLLAGSLNVNYLYRGRAGIIASYWPGDMYIIAAEYSGPGLGLGIDIEYKLYKRIYLGFNINYTHYFYKMSYVSFFPIPIKRHVHMLTDCFQIGYRF